MKLLKGMVLGLFAAGFVLLLSSVSFAEEKNPEAFVKLLKDSAAALQQSNLVLSDSLTKFATEEAKEKMEKEEKNETKEMKEPEGTKGHKAEHIKLLKDAAAALQVSRPDLTAELTKYISQKTKKMEEGKGK